MQYLNIRTTNLHIRNLLPKDLHHFHTYRSNPEIARYQGFDIMTQEEAAAFITTQTGKQFGRPGEWVQYGIEHRQAGHIVGDCAIKLQEADPRIAEIGITISHLHQRQGYAKEALKGIVNFLFNEQHIHRIVETVDAENAASIGLLRSLGFRQEGHFIENVFFKGSWGSELQFAMLRREWEGRITI